MWQQVLSVIIWTVAPIALITVPVGLFNRQMFRVVHSTKPRGMQLVEAFCPFANLTYARRLAYGSAGLITAGLCVCAGLMLFRIVSLLLLTIVPVLLIYSSFAAIGAIVLFVLLYVVNALDFCRMFSCGPMTYILSIIIPPIGYYMLSVRVPNYYASVADEVSGRFGD